MAAVTTPSPALRDRAIAEARNLPDLIRRLRAVDPELAAVFAGKSLFGSRSIWGPPIAWGVTWAAARYGLGWDHDTVTWVSGMISFAVIVMMRWFTRVPITSVLPPAKAPA